MRLLVKDRKSKKKIFVRVIAESRDELVTKINADTFKVKGQIYSVNDVIAVPSSRFSSWKDIIQGGKKDTENANKFNISRVTRKGERELNE
jgi:hypothetical protein